MSQVEKLEGLLAKVQANRQLPRASHVADAPGVPAPLASQTPISVAPPPETAVASEPPSKVSEPPGVASLPPVEGSEPAIEIGAPREGALSAEAVSMPDVLSASGSPWQVVGTAVPGAQSKSFVELLELSLSLKPR